MCMLDKTLAKKIDELRKKKDEIDVLEAQMNDIKDELKVYLQEKEIDSYEFVYEGSKYSFSNKTSTQMRFDQSAFKEEYKDLFESFKRAVPQTKFLWK